MLDDFDLDVPEGPPPEESGNRTFMIVAGGLGGFMLISIICLAVVFFMGRGGGDDGEGTELTAEAINANNTEVAEFANQTATADSYTPTITATLPPTATQVPPTATATEVELIVTTEVTQPVDGGPTVNPSTATVEALLTQASLAQTQAASAILTVTPTPTVVLPDSGFADNVGLMGLFTLTAMLVLVIVFVRRLRFVNS
ncbi:MAG: hypothetical protein FVQ83_03080 [Chloroflexi bacterium]|nr:hypothetical protein [Chloroflexota bacterium]